MTQPPIPPHHGAPQGGGQQPWSPLPPTQQMPQQQWGGATPPPPPPPPRKGMSKGLLFGLIAGGLALLLIVVGGGIALGRMLGSSSSTARPSVTGGPTTIGRPMSTTAIPTATARPTSATGTTPRSTSAPATGSATEFSGARFTAPIPAGWTVAAGSTSEGKITDGKGADITVYDLRPRGTGDAKARCATELKALSVWAPGTIATLPDTTWGGKPAFGGSLTGSSGTYYEIYCQEVGEAIYSISVKTRTASKDAGVAALKTVMTGWRWR